MTEREQLVQLNEGLKRVEHTLNKLNDAMIGNEFTPNGGMVQRLDKVEDKLKKLDKMLYILIGIISMGTIPLGSAILPYIKEYIFKII